MQLFNLHSSKSDIQNYLMAQNCLNEGEIIEEITKPGEGNMNVVLRVKTNQRSLILKQSRPFVQKYQDIKAPLERIEVEHQFYNCIHQTEVNDYFPKIYFCDLDNYVLLLEDLGNCKDMSHHYNSGSLKEQQIETLLEILNGIHSQTEITNYPLNTSLRNLNHQHIFVLPFLEDNGFALDSVQEGLQDISLVYKKDVALKRVVEKIGRRYLSKGDVLLHGDFYPGSWMENEQKLYIIDPEFSFLGFREFDIGVMLAHIILMDMNDSIVHTFQQNYSWKIDFKLAKQVAGIEIIRRIIGLAQLPLQRSLNEKEYLLQMARKMILT